MSVSPETLEGIIERHFNKVLVPKSGVASSGQVPGVLVGIGLTTGPYYFKLGEVPIHQGNVQPETEHILMYIGSNTKVFTATLLALAEIEPSVTQLPISSQTPVADLLPNGTTINLFENYPIELWHLATHSAGFPDGPCPQPPAKAVFGDYTFDFMSYFLANFTPGYQPGTAWIYSDQGFALLGALLSHAYTPPTGTLGGWDPTYQNWPSTVLNNVLTPLGMASTQAGPPINPDWLAQPFVYQGGSVYGFTEPPDFVMDSAALGAGSLCSNLEDMLTFLLNQIAPQSNSLGQAIALTQVAQANDTLSMGLGWQLGNNFFYKNGLVTGYASYMAFDPVNCVAVVAMANCLGGDDGGAVCNAARGVLGELRGYEAVGYGFPMGYPKPTCPTTT